MAKTGRQTPTFEQVKKFTETDGDQAAALASAFFGEPLEWQRHVINVMLARSGKDKFLFHTIGLSVARQNGKSWSVHARVFYGLITAGEKILYTCQHGDTADEMFKDLSAPFEDEDNEELHGLLRTVRKTNGQQAIYLKNGGLIRFTTRTNSLARGKSFDTLIYDEAQDLTKAQQAASLPTISASKQHNTQVIYIGTPPDSEAPGEVFKPIHDRVHKGKAPNVAWIEWAAPDIEDPHDKHWWYETNPSLGLLIDETAISGEADQFSPDDFARERLGWWNPDTLQFDAAIDPVAWDKCRVDKAPKDGKIAFGIKFAPDSKNVAVAGCVLPDDGKPYVEIVDVRSMPGSMRWIIDFVKQREDTAALFAIDGRAYSQALVQDLIKENVSQRAILAANASEVMAASQMLVTRISDQEVEHYGQPGLDRCVKGCAKRPIGTNGGWGFGDGTAPGYVVDAVALALYACITTKRNPSGGGMIIW